MKRFNLKLFAVSIIMAIVAISCIDDKFDTPPIKELPVGSVVTLQNLRDLCPPGNTFKIKGDSSLYATVTMDESSGNLYKTVFVQDNTGAVNLRFSSSTTLSEGDSIRIYLKGAILSWYNNLFQIDSLHADYSVIKQAVNRNVEPQVVSITDINLDKSFFQSRLVKIENVQIRESDLGKPWAPYQEYGEVSIEDLNGNTMLIRTSGYSKFASQTVPEGLGSMIAVVGLYRETVQLTIRRASEINFTEPRYVPVVTGTGTKADPWDVATGITLQNQDPRKVGFVKGFIVGSVKTGVTSVASTDDIHFTTPVTSATNVVIADDPNERDLSKLLVVNLPSSKPLRTQVNLLDNPGNLGKWLNVSGALRTYFGLAGSRDSSGDLTEFELEGGGEDPGPGEVVEITIADLRALYQGSNVTIPAGKKIIGTVVSDKDAQNIHAQNIQIVDAEGSGIMVRFTAAHSFAINDKIEVNVSNNSLESYNGLLQVNNVNLTNASKVGTGTVEPITITINDLKANFEQYESKLVRILNATITNSAGTYGGNNGNSNISDASGQMVLYTRSQATFAATAVPATAKTVIGIVSEYSTSTNPNNYQILLRNLSDVQ